MSTQQDFFLVVAVMTAVTVPALGQTPLAPGAGSETHSGSIPNLTGVWNHPAFPWFEPPASGPGPVTNLSRWGEQRVSSTGGGSLASPPSTEGISDYDQLVGDYNN